MQWNLNTDHNEPGRTTVKVERLKAQNEIKFAKACTKKKGVRSNLRTKKPKWLLSRIYL